MTRAALLALPLLVLAGCSGAGPGGAPEANTATLSPTADAATRAAPVVPGRPGRVFVFAGVGKACEQLPAPELTITTTPTKGDVSFVANQETAIAASAQGTCLGTKTKGTGVYYVARAGSTGTDTFAVSAKLGSGESSSRTFQVTIAE